jgi:hypothetical protein
VYPHSKATKTPILQNKHANASFKGKTFAKQCLILFCVFTYLRIGAKKSQHYPVISLENIQLRRFALGLVGTVFFRMVSSVSFLLFGGFYWHP